MARLRFEAALVGMRFRPPAEDVVRLLAGNTELLAVRQPENPYDQNAISVQLHGFCEGGQHDKLWRQFRQEAIENTVDQAEGSPPAYNQDLLDRLTDPLPLGFICNSEKTGGKHADTISNQMDLAGMASVPCLLTFDLKGQPLIVIEADFEEQAEADDEEDAANAED